MIEIKDLKNCIIKLKNLENNLRINPQNISIYKKLKLNLENEIKKYEIILENIKNCASFKKIIENENYDKIVISFKIEKSIIFYKNDNVTKMIVIDEKIFNEEIIKLIKELKIKI